MAIGISPLCPPILDLLELDRVEEDPNGDGDNDGDGGTIVGTCGLLLGILSRSRNCTN